MKKRLSLPLAALFLASTMLAAPALATGGHDDGKDKEKKYICHATGSEKNPYVLLRVPTNSAHFDKDKHPDDVKPVFDKDKKKLVCPKKDDHKY